MVRKKVNKKTTKKVTKKVVKKTPTKASRPKPGTIPAKKTQPADHVDEFIMAVYGQPGVGKTTFVNNFSDRVLFLSTDRGTRFLEAFASECLTWDDFDKAVSALERDKDRFDIIAIDHVDDWANAAETYVLQKLRVETLTDAGYGKGWSLYKSTLHRMVARLKALCTGIVFLAHEDWKTVKVQGLDVDQCRPKMSKQAWDVIIPLCDIVAYAGFEVVKSEGKRKEIRTVTTQPRKDLYAKDRSAREKKVREPLDGAKFVSTFKE